MNPTTFAYMNHGRWVADCPNPDCPEAHAVPDPAFDLPVVVFDCANCGGFALVTYPDNYRHIVAALQTRPVPQTRNWAPPETVADLHAENFAKGIR